MKRAMIERKTALLARNSAVFAAMLLMTSAATSSDSKSTQQISKLPPLRPAVIDETLVITGEEIEASKLRSRMTVDVGINGTGPYRFVVDSGADSSVIGDGLASALNLSPGRAAILNSVTEARKVERVVVDSMQIGSTAIKDLLLPRLAEKDIGAMGIIGLDALAGQRMMLDFDRRKVTIDDALRTTVRMDGEIVVSARLKRGQLILTQVKANNQSLDAVIDTGSEITIGNAALRDQILRQRNVTLTKAEVIGVTGASMPLEVAMISEFKLGPITLRNVRVAFAKIPPFDVFGLNDRPALLLGTDLMQNFSRISLDFHARKVRFQLRQCDTHSAYIGRTIAVSQASLDPRERRSCGN
jgi:predicted aspartyl protease